MIMKPYRPTPEFYDAETQDMKILQRDVPFFLDHLPKKRQEILELAVGTARAAIPIAQAGHRVVGVDNNRGMLALARRKRDSVGIRDRDLDLRHGDILKLNLRQKFDWVCLFFNTMLAFTSLEQQDRLLQSVRCHLRPRGHFWLDIFYPDLARLAQERSTDTHAGLFHLVDGRTVMHTVDVRREPASQLQRLTFHYRWFDSRGIERRQKNEFGLTYIFPRELQLLLERNGLKIEKLYGNYDASPIKSDSPRIIALCQRL